MRNIIKYYYELDKFDYYKINNKYKIKYRDNIYYFYSVNNINEFEKIAKIIYNKNNYYKIILNKDGNMLSEVNGIYYCLFFEVVKDFSLIEEINIYDYVTDGKNYINNWSDLWSRKIDYLEYQLLHVENKYNILSEYIDYFIGLGEVAISYINNIEGNILKTNLDRLVVCHRRINHEDYFNPLNVVFDHKARDYAEYLKYLFYKEYYKSLNIKYIISTFKLSDYGYHLLFGRLLFNSYFFDTYDLIINKVVDESEIIYIIKRINEYEDYLIYIYKCINEIVILEKIDFL